MKTVFNRMKRDFGIPIALADPEHGKVLEYMIDKTNMRALRDDKQLILVDAMEITRKFTTAQHKAFRDNVQAYYNSNGFNLEYL